MRFLILKDILSFMSIVFGSGLLIINASCKILLHKNMYKYHKIDIFYHFQDAAPFLLVHKILILIMVYLRIYVCAESAGNMTSAVRFMMVEQLIFIFLVILCICYDLKGEDMGQAVYSTAWYTERPEVVTAKTMIILRCQKLPVISINGVMPTLNRRYLASVISFNKLLK